MSLRVLRGWQQLSYLATHEDEVEKEWEDGVSRSEIREVLGSLRVAMLNAQRDLKRQETCFSQGQFELLSEEHCRQLRVLEWRLSLLSRAMAALSRSLCLMTLDEKRLTPQRNLNLLPSSARLRSAIEKIKI